MSLRRQLVREGIARLCLTIDTGWFGNSRQYQACKEERCYWQMNGGYTRCIAATLQSCEISPDGRTEVPRRSHRQGEGDGRELDRCRPDGIASLANVAASQGRKAGDSAQLRR